MAYSQGGLIEANDYNNFLNGTHQINTIWSTGTGSTGYGQTALNAVASGGSVSASQWSSLINTLNNMYFHQTGSGSGISAVTSGGTIYWLSALASSITTAYTNRSLFASQGSTVTGSVYSPNYTVSATTAAQTWTFTRTITFASADQARYFFNSGGQLNFVTTSATNNDSSTRSADWTTLIGTNFNSLSAIQSLTNGGRSGVGGTVNTAITNFGYYNLTTTGVTVSKILSLSPTYSGDYIQLNLRSNGTQGANSDAGSVIYLDFTVYSAATRSSFNQSINVTWNHRIDVVYPETTNLSNSWGTVTIT
jgi:hypothetical protein